MKPLFNLFWSICRLQSGPDDVPYSLPILALTLVLNFLIAWYQFSYRSDITEAALQSALLLVVMGGYTYIVLTIKGLRARFLQTFTALSGIHVILNSVVIPLMVLHPYIIYEQQHHLILFFATLFFLFAMIVINVWLIMVTSHIFSRALQITMMLGVLVTVGLLGSEALIFSQFFGYK